MQDLRRQIRRIPIKSNYEALGKNANVSALSPIQGGPNFPQVPILCLLVNRKTSSGQRLTVDKDNLMTIGLEVQLSVRKM